MCSGICRRLVGIEGRTVVAGIAPLDLVDEVRGEDVRLFDDAHRGLGGVGLAVVEGNRPDVAARGGLADGIRAGLTSIGKDEGERVRRSGQEVNAIRGGPIDETRGVGGDVVVLQSR